MLQIGACVDDQRARWRAGTRADRRTWAAEQAEALHVPVRPIEAVPLAAMRLWMDRSGREQSTRCAAAGQVAGSTGVSRSAKMEVVLAVVAMATATRNRVLYKLALVPLREYPSFLVQFTTFGYPSSPRLSIFALHHC
jgi:hypothetical protein